MFTLDARKQGEESDYQSATYQRSGEDLISILFRISQTQNLPQFVACMSCHQENDRRKVMQPCLTFLGY